MRGHGNNLPGTHNPCWVNTAVQQNRACVGLCAVPMTTRSLHKTWRQVLCAEYASDFAPDVPFPIRYSIHTPHWKKALAIEIPNKVPAEAIHRSLSLAPTPFARRTASPRQIIKTIIYLSEPVYGCSTHAKHEIKNLPMKVIIWKSKDLLPTGDVYIEYSVDL